MRGTFIVGDRVRLKATGREWKISESLTDDVPDEPRGITASGLLPAKSSTEGLPNTSLNV
jgi:hypothetical protein